MNPYELEGAVTHGTRESWASLSPCGEYRYLLGRMWDEEAGEYDWQRPIFSIVMLNPSTADHTADDPTIRKVIHFAKQEGCGGLLVRNLFAYRATDKSVLRYVEDPIGPLNEKALSLQLLFALRVAAWGELDSQRMERKAAAAIMRVKMAGRALHLFELTKRGHPRHPLYLPNATRVRPWSHG